MPCPRRTRWTRRARCRSTRTTSPADGAMTRTVFRDRVEAGEVLAARLGHYAGRAGAQRAGAADVLVLALPRGGVPVGARVAPALGAPLDVFVVRKLGVPGNEEVVRELHVDDATIQRVADAEGRELARRERSYRGDRPPPDLAGRVVILVDDGLATGSTMRAAVAAARAAGPPARVVVAVPTAPAATCEQLRREADEVVCATTPWPFRAVGYSYRSFPQTTDEEVRELLRAAWTAAEP